MKDPACMSFKEIKKLLKTKKLGYREIWESVKRKIEENEEYINGYITLFTEEVEEDVKKLDEKGETPSEKKPLLGLFLAVKDNIAVKGKPLTCASKILSKYVSPYDATAVKRLKNKGALIVGKTNMDEFAMGSSTEYSAFGITRNPFDKERVPGGSSGGSAAVVAYGGAIASLGSDTGGSVRQPAAFCNLYGFKPTYGRVSRYGLVAFASSLDVIGPIARSAEDIMEIYKVIAGWDENDSTSLAYPLREPRDLKFKGLKIGIIKETMEENHPKVTRVIEETLKNIEKMGAYIKDYSLPLIKKSVAAYQLIAMAEASSNLARYDGVRYGLRVKKESIEEMYKETRGEGFGEEVKRRVMLGTFVLSSGYYDRYYAVAVSYRNRLKAIFEDIFKEVDFIITPTSPTPPFKIGEKKDPISMYLSDVYTAPFSLIGYPSITVPSSQIAENGFKVGIQITGGWLSDEDVIKLGGLIGESCC